MSMNHSTEGLKDTSYLNFYLTYMVHMKLWACTTRLKDFMGNM